MHVITFCLPNIFIRVYDYSHFSDDKDEVGKSGHYLLKSSLDAADSQLMPFLIGHTRIYMSFIVHAGNYDEARKCKEKSSLPDTLK